MDFVGDIIAAPFICIGWIIVGAIAGSLARSITSSPDMPIIYDILLGIAGAFTGGVLAALFGVGPDEGTSGIALILVNLVIATVGAIVLIGLRRAVTR